MVVLVIAAVYIVAKPLVTEAIAENQKVTTLSVEETVAWLGKGSSFGEQLAITALERTKERISYDPAYYVISYPNGDIPDDKGVCTDVVIRSYRALGMDLQELIHEDMENNFRIYPQLWNLKKPDTNIDHRRVPNLQRFFSRQGAEINISGDLTEANFQLGDVVAWRLPDAQTHIGIVVPGPGDRKNEKWIVHNIGNGPKWENRLLDYQIIGQYRYNGVQTVH